MHVDCHPQPEALLQALAKISLEDATIEISTINFLLLFDQSTLCSLITRNISEIPFAFDLSTSRYLITQLKRIMVSMLALETLECSLLVVESNYSTSGTTWTRFSLLFSFPSHKAMHIFALLAFERQKIWSSYSSMTYHGHDITYSRSHCLGM